MISQIHTKVKIIKEKREKLQEIFIHKTYCIVTASNQSVIVKVKFHCIQRGRKYPCLEFHLHNGLYNSLIIL